MDKYGVDHDDDDKKLKGDSSYHKSHFIIN